MDLPEALQNQKENFLKAVPEETVTVLKDALENLSNSGILSHCLKNGEKAPDFSLKGVNNEPISLKNHLENGPVILKFFRGDW